MIDLVGEGHDLAIRAGPLADSTLLTRKLGCARLVLCASPAYFAANTPPTQIAELRSHKCLAVSGSNSTVEWLFTTKDMQAHKVRPAHVFLANNTAALRQAALSGLGIALLPELSVADHLESARLRRVLPDHEPATLDIHAVFQPRSQTAPRVRRFVEFVAARLRN
jgi:DNA-binding transcriptional LysR family regulator